MLDFRNAGYDPAMAEVPMAFLQFCGVLATALFAGAAIYINVAEHPARMECGTAVAATVFGPSYRRAAAMQLLLASVAAASAFGTWLMGATALWLIGALLIFAVVPFTYVAIMPINKRLLDPAMGRSSEAARGLLERWGRLHAVRSALALASSAVLLASLVWRV